LSRRLPPLFTPQELRAMEARRARFWRWGGARGLSVRENARVLEGELAGMHLEIRTAITAGMASVTLAGALPYASEISYARGEDGLVRCATDEATLEPALRDLVRGLFEAAPSLRAVHLTKDGAKLTLARSVEPEELDAAWEGLTELGRLTVRGYR
jgi:hypothetical protein